MTDLPSPTRAEKHRYLFLRCQIILPIILVPRMTRMMGSQIRMIILKSAIILDSCKSLAKVMWKNLINTGWRTNTKKNWAEAGPGQARAEPEPRGAESGLAEPS